MLIINYNLIDFWFHFSNFIFFSTFCVYLLFYLKKKKLKNFNEHLFIIFGINLFIYLLIFILLYEVIFINIKIDSLNNTLILTHSILLIKLFLIILIILTLYIFKYYLVYVKNNIKIEVFLTILVNFQAFLNCLNRTDFITLILLFELFTLINYFLIINKKSIFSTEGGLKYFIIGSLSTRLMLLGFMLIHYSVGTLKSTDVKIMLELFNTTCLNISILSKYNFIVNIGLISITISLLIKLGIAPFHMWMLDAYEGTDKYIFFFLNFVYKYFLFIYILYFYYYFCLYFFLFNTIIFICSICSIIIGSCLSVLQFNIKRLFIYSSINNLGFLLLGINLFELNIYYSLCLLFFFYPEILLLLLIFIIIWSNNLKLYNNNIFEFENIYNLHNLFRTNKLMALLLLFILFNFNGLPPLMFFFSKFYFLLNLFNYWSYFLIIFIFIFNIINIIIYIKLIKIILFEKKKNWIYVYIPTYSMALILSLGLIYNLIILFYPNIILFFIFNFL